MKLSLDSLDGNYAAKTEAALDITCPDIRPFRFTLNNSEVILGREEDCSICLPRSSVSRHHAQITWDGEDYVLEDLDSTNGTIVNNVRVSKCKLRNHDLIRIGEASLMFIIQKTTGKA